MVDLTALSATAKTWLVDIIGSGRDGSHVMLGMALFVGAIWLLRGRYVRTAWFALLAIELVNEWIDAGFRATTTVGSMKDICTTMIGPSLIWIVLAIERRSARPRSGENREQPSE